MLIPVDNLASLGFIPDIPPSKLPPQAWSGILNMRFSDGVVRKANGHTSILTPTVAPYGLFPAPVFGSNFWAYTGLTKVYGFLGSSSQADITRAAGDYTGGVLDRWNGCIFNEIPILNNGVDVPQAWSPVSLSQRLVNLSAWQAGAKAAVMRTFKNFLIGLDVTRGATHYRRMVKWSHPAATGLPTSWDETDATKDAGELLIPEGVDSLIDCLPLGDANILYTETSAWAMTISGTSTIFNLLPRFRSVGLLAQSCVAEFLNKHLCWTQDDVVVHNGVQAQSIIDGRLRQWLFAALGSSAYSLSTVAVHRPNREIWLCFAQGGGAVLNTALIWNWYLNTWTIRDLPNARAVAYSMYSPGAISNDLWDAGPAGSWNAGGTGAWGETIRSRQQEGILIGTPDPVGIFLVDESQQFNGVNFRSYVERVDICATSVGRDGSIINDPRSTKLFSRVRPVIYADDGTSFLVYIGSRDFMNKAVVWQAPETFVVGTDYKSDASTTGKFLAIRIEATADDDWELLGYDMEVAVLGTEG